MISAFTNNDDLIDDGTSRFLLPVHLINFLQTYKSPQL